MTIIYNGSYRDEELNILYRIVCGLVPVDEKAQQFLDPEQRTYEAVEVVLHSISRKNRDPKVYTYLVSEIITEAGGEWNSHNYHELNNEIKARLQNLTGYTDNDFTSPS